jgi:hypothetical protein
MEKSINSKTIPESLVASVSKSVILPQMLRVGNYLCIDNLPSKVEGFTPNDNSTDFNNKEYFKILFEHPKYKSTYETFSDEKVERIELSIKWLFDLGFEFYEVLSHYRIVINDVWYQIKMTETEGFIFSFTNLNYDEVNHMPPKKISFVDELQNLFFFLSDFELTVC